MLVIIIALFGISCLVGGTFLDGASSYRYDVAKKTSNCFGVVALVIATIMGIAMIITFSISLDTVNKMKNFYERNYVVFGSAVEKFPDATTVKTQDGTVETVKLSWDYVHEILSYNENLKWYRQYQDNWFYSSFVSHVSEDLDFIEPKPKQ